MLNKKQRKQINYEEYEPLLPNEFHKTSEWNKEVVNKMKIEVTNNNIFELEYNYTDPINIMDNEWKDTISIKDLPLSPEYKTLVLELKRVYDSENTLAEHYIDTYVDTLLHILKFHYYPLTINLKHKFEIKIDKEVCVTSIPDFVIMSEYSKLLIIVEDKNIKNATNFNQWKESQIMGEIFTAIHALKIEQDINLYGVRIIGTLFTFYKAMITLDYILDTVGPKIPTKHSMTVYRYPDPDHLTRVHHPNISTGRTFYWPKLNLSTMSNWNKEFMLVSLGKYTTVKTKA
ncbi:hypothetical protein CONCODRAFT_7978 [Conidiobolus coronatus NRRL 28638]|uniref:Uncharacterized protein n=1 Tax=Conidiobolus coronatus (strain ATCC 28846 / CBS 209.66 / NRRL 28638) TaxID=796925 RepID=A0A137P3G4_CONC2|nr:hypothetical protein CONCODRAFT_7978 [Conidiobolus coronatus NRRL 28638]|eukprot:KXN69566.1 hypothetical protein CONCODRAFT_7978 [Conidiobolus coronatus NRRL 28638]